MAVACNLEKGIQPLADRIMTAVLALTGVVGRVSGHCLQQPNRAMASCRAISVTDGEVGACCVDATALDVRGHMAPGSGSYRRRSPAMRCCQAFMGVLLENLQDPAARGWILQAQSVVRSPDFKYISVPYTITSCTQISALSIRPMGWPLLCSLCIPVPTHRSPHSWSTRSSSCGTTVTPQQHRLCE